MPTREDNDPILYSSTEDFRTGSPPNYRQTASTSNIHNTSLDLDTALPSPAYKSKSSLRIDMPNSSQEDFNDVPLPDTKRSVHHKGPSDFIRAPSPTTTIGTDTDDNGDDDYDWSGEEDLVDEQAKFEDRMGVKKPVKGWGLKRIFTLLFSSLIGSTLLAGIIVTPAILIHYYWYKKNPTEHRRFIKDNVQAWLFWAAANLLISWYLALIVDIIPIFITFIISASWGHVSEYIKSRLELYTSVKNTFKPVLYAACGWASWVIIFQTIFKLYNSDSNTVSDAAYLDRVYEVVEFLFFFALVVCAQKMLSHAIAFSFHRIAFKDRLAEVHEALYVIEKLRDYRPKHHARRSSGMRSGLFTPLFGGTPAVERERFQFPNLDEDADDEDATVVGTNKSRKNKGKSKGKHFFQFGTHHKSSHSNTIDTSQALYSDREEREMEMEALGSSSRPMTPNSPDADGSVSPHRYPPTRNLIQTPRHSDEDGGIGITHAAKVIKNAVLHDARNIKGKSDSSKGLLGVGVGSTSEAKRLARNIFMKLRDRSSRRNYLLVSDFQPAFPTKAKAEAAFRVFDKDNNGDISRQEVKAILVKVYKDRRSLAKSMRDVGVALKTLDHILLCFALIILFFISLSIFGVDVSKSLTSVYTLGIAASFIFKTSASSAFDAIMFLFVTHPFDTGDLCFIDTEIMVVKKMGLFATVFRRVDGTETYYFNSQLFTKFITNVRRSGKMFENVTMQVAWRTPLSKLDELEKCLNGWLATEENRWFDPNTSIALQNLEYQRYLEITIGIPHNGTWQDWGLKCTRKTAFHAAVQYYCRQLNIVAYEVPIPVTWGTSRLDQAAVTRSQVDDTYEDEVREAIGDGAKPSMFFKAPVNDSSHMRARRAKSKKAAFRAMDG